MGSFERLVPKATVTSKDKSNIEEGTDPSSLGNAGLGSESEGIDKDQIYQTRMSVMRATYMLPTFTGKSKAALRSFTSQESEDEGFSHIANQAIQKEAIRHARPTIQ